MPSTLRVSLNARSWAARFPSALTRNNDPRPPSATPRPNAAETAWPVPGSTRTTVLPSATSIWSLAGIAAAAKRGKGPGTTVARTDGANERYPRKPGSLWTLPMSAERAASS